MSAPFQPGDVVVCVDDRGCWHLRCINPSPTTKLIRGKVYRVSAAFKAADGLDVILVGGPPHTCGCHYGCGGFRPDRFRKIDDEVTEEFREQLRRIKAPRPLPAAPVLTAGTCVPSRFPARLYSQTEA